MDVSGIHDEDDDLHEALYFEIRAVRAVMRAFYDVGSFNDGVLPAQCTGERSIFDFFRELNPDVADSYIEEKAEIWRRSPHRMVMSFDKKRFAAFVAWCVKHFGGK